MPNGYVDTISCGATIAFAMECYEKGIIGPTAGVAIDPTEFDVALDIYYQLLAWTTDGTPTRTALADLGIE